MLKILIAGGFDEINKDLLPKVHAFATFLNRLLEAIGADRYKTYRIYRTQLPC